MNAPKRVADRPRKAWVDPSTQAYEPMACIKRVSTQVHPASRPQNDPRDWPQLLGLGGPSGRSQSMSVNFPPETSADFCRIRLAGLRVEKR